MNTSRDSEAYATKVGGFIINMILVIVLKFENELMLPPNFYSTLNKIATEAR